MDRIDIFIEKLRGIAEELNDASMQILSEAISDGKTQRPALEKKISQARRAVEKAIHHLDGTSTD